jgi:hypothetical protein
MMTGKIDDAVVIEIGSPTKNEDDMECGNKIKDIHKAARKSEINFKLE